MTVTSKTHQTVVLPKTLTRELKRLAKSEGRSMTKLVEFVMKKYSEDLQCRISMNYPREGK